MATAINRPKPDEHAAYYARYIDLIDGDDALPVLISQIEGTTRMLERLDNSAALHRYAPDKWSVKQVVGHLCDAERVFAYRALRIARADATPLPGFDENQFVANANFDSRPLPDLVLELRALRAASVALFGSLPPEAMTRRGTANDQTISVRALAWCIVGHERHHGRLLGERYGLRPE